MRHRNWLGNVTWEPSLYAQPSTEAEVCALVEQAARAGKSVRLVGSGHSWSTLCATEDYCLNLDRLARVVHIDHARCLVTVEAGIRLKDLCTHLLAQGLALINLGSILEQSIAGAVSTATHGSGISFGNLATQVVAMRLVLASGEVLIIGPDQNAALLPAVRVSLGALGIVTQVTLRVVPAFYLHEEREPLPFDEVLPQLPALIPSADHFKLWWFPHAPVMQLYRQHRTQEPAQLQAAQHRTPAFLREDSKFTQLIFQSLLRLGERFPQQLPRLQRFLTTLAFRRRSQVGHSFQVFTLAMPPLHHESEYAVPVARAAEALLALRTLIQERSHRVNFVTEIRFVARDDSWLSPSYEREVCYIGGYHAGDAAWPRFLKDYEALMLQLGGRPHWGKEFTLSATQLQALYPRWQDFCALRRKLDPAGTFLNPLLRRLFEPT